MYFGYWGCFTWAGSRRYDEMDAIIPGFALFIGVILSAIAFILTLILFVRYRKQKNNLKKQ